MAKFKTAALWLILVVGGIIALTIAITPLAAVALQSFSTDIRGFSGSLGLESYGRMLRDPVIARTLIDTFSVASLTTLIATLAGIPIAILSHLCSARYRRLVPVLLFALLATPELVGAITMSYSWTYLGAPDGPLSIALCMVFFGTPIISLLVLGRLGRVDVSNIFISAVTLGAPSWRAALIVCRAVMLPTLGIGCTLIFILSIQDFMYGFFSGRGGIQTLGVVLYTSLRFGINNMLYAVASLLALIAFSVSIFASTYLRRIPQ